MLGVTNNKGSANFILMTSTNTNIMVSVISYTQVNDFTFVLNSSIKYHVLVRITNYRMQIKIKDANGVKQ